MTDHTDSAFPRPAFAGQMTGGLSKREWFAGIALSNPAICHSDLFQHQKAITAVEVADLILELLNPPEPDTTTAHQVGMGIGGGK